MKTLRRGLWWVLFLICLVYGGFALTMGFSELLYLMGMMPQAKHREVPVVFVIHSLAGGIALLGGPLQFSRWLRRRVAVHRAIGRTYVIAVLVASVFAVLDARTFAVSSAAKVVFLVIATSWAWSTVLAVLRAKAGQFAAHREWVIRSFSLSLFFVTFSFWVPLLPGSYVLAISLSAGLNLVAAESWIRRSRTSPVVVDSARPASAGAMAIS